MKKLLLLLLFIPLVSFGQSQEAMKLCISYSNSINSFVSESEADDALHKIISVIGASTNFILQPCNDINNALAVTYKGNRYILYDKNFLQELNYKSNNWSSMFILAHEIGHHINGHTRELTISNQLDPQSLSEQREEELEADEFAGFVLSSLGASYDEAVRGISLWASDRDDRYSTHPNKSKRLEAIRLGFNKPNKTSKNTPNSSNKSRITDVIFFEDGSRWEGPVKLDSYYANDGEQILTVTEKTPYGKGIFIFNDGTIYKGFWYEGLLTRKTNTSKKSSSTNLNNANNIYNRGLAKFKLKNYKGAIADFNKAIEIDPNYADAYNYRGLAKSVKDSYGAIADYTKAIELKPNFADAYNYRGAAKDDLKDYYGAIADYTKAIELDPNYAYAYRKRAETKDDLKDSYGAIADYTKAIELDPNYAYAYSNRANVNFSLKDYAGAIADYTKAIELDPNFAKAYYNRGLSKDDLKDYSGAITDYTKYIELNPNFAKAYSNRGTANLSLKDYYGAIADYTKAIELDPNNVSLYLNRGTAKFKLKNYKGAIADFNKAIEIDPNYADAYYNRGTAKYYLNDNSGACADWRIAASKGHQNAPILIKDYCN